MHRTLLRFRPGRFEKSIFSLIATVLDLRGALRCSCSLNACLSTLVMSSRLRLGHGLQPKSFSPTPKHIYMPTVCTAAGRRSRASLREPTCRASPESKGPLRLIQSAAIAGAAAFILAAGVILYFWTDGPEDIRRCMMPFQTCSSEVLVIDDIACVNSLCVLCRAHPNVDAYSHCAIFGFRVHQVAELWYRSQ